jgi:NADPH-dependent 2,4-dienoyl-CoA reductase/sulfur reductase-like enzyme
VEIVDDQVIVVGRKQDLEKLERTKIPDNLEIEAKPVVAIIGGGAAGFTCADMLRQNGFRGRIVLFTREGTLPYDRVQLSKQPLKKPQDLLLRDHPYYKKAKIDLMLDTDVTTINWTTKNLTYQTLGKQMKSEQYDYLVLATGLRSRKLPASIPGGDLRSIFYLRSMEDANNLVNKVKSPETKNIVIIGDSFIALELCGWITTGLAGPDGKQEETEKKNVSVVMLLKAPMIRIFGEKVALALQKVHEKNGAKFYSEANVTELTGEHNVVKFVQLATGESIPCDLVIVAIGSETCTELYKNSPIEMTEDQFIKVNDRLETSVDHVLAVGDISKYPLRVFNLDEVNCQHWQMACSTGHQAADTILHHYLGQTKGSSRPLKTDLYTTPIYWTTQNNKTTIRYAGYTRDPENVVIHGDLDGEFKFVAYYIVDGYVRAVAQSKYDPLSSEVAEIFHHKRNIRREDIENDIYGYRKYLDFKTKKPE